MKRFITLCLILGVLTGLLVSCQSGPKTDAPRYTSDQVIEIAKASNEWQAQFPDGQYFAEYEGEGVWTVRYSFFAIWTTPKTNSWHFYESEGKLVEDENPINQ